MITHPPGNNSTSNKCTHIHWEFPQNNTPPLLWACIWILSVISHSLRDARHALYTVLTVVGLRLQFRALLWPMILRRGECASHACCRTWARRAGHGGQALCSCLTFCLCWVCFSIRDLGLVPEPKGQMEENREGVLRPGARSQGVHGRGDVTTGEKCQFPTPWGPGPEQEGGPGGPAEVRLAGPLGLRAARWAHRVGSSLTFFLCQPGANCGSHRTFLSLLPAGDPAEHGHVRPGPVPCRLPER